MGHLEYFRAVIILIGATTLISAEAPLPANGKPAWSMTKGEMIYESRSVERNSPLIRRDTNNQVSGWTPYKGATGPSASSSSTSYQQSSYTPPSRPSGNSNYFNDNTIQPPVPQNSGSTYQTLPSIPEFQTSPNFYTPSSPTSYQSSSSSSSGSGYGSASAEKDIRFVVHKAGEEDQVRNILSKQYGNVYGDMISFLRGPTFKFENKQKVHLPPKPKTIVFVLLRSPEFNTETEVIPSQYDPKPEVRIVYQKSEGVKTQHYSPEPGSKPNQGY